MCLPSKTKMRKTDLSGRVEWSHLTDFLFWVTLYHRTAFHMSKLNIYLLWETTQNVGPFCAGLSEVSQEGDYCMHPIWMIFHSGWNYNSTCATGHPHYDTTCLEGPISSMSKEVTDKFVSMCCHTVLNFNITIHQEWETGSPESFSINAKVVQVHSDFAALMQCSMRNEHKNVRTLLMDLT